MQIKAIVIIVALVFISGLFPVSGQQRLDHSLEEAKRLWELAVEAKGGRKRLRSVNSFAVIEAGTLNGVRNCDLYSLPDKFWRWVDLRPTVLGLSVDVVNRSLNRSYSTDHSHPDNPLTEELKPETGEEELATVQLTYFLETLWFKPNLVTSAKEFIGLKEFDVVEIKLRGMPVKIFLDKNTHLPARVAYYSTYNGRMFTWSDLSDYKSVNGILIPHKKRDDSGPRIALKIEVNPQFDPKAFERPAKIEDGPEQWRLKVGN